MIFEYDRQMSDYLDRMLADKEHFAKDADGTKNDKWCSYCFHDGALEK